MTDVIAALIWDGDKFLACQRPANKARGLLWEFVGGKTEPGETPRDALIRECREELDVVVEPMDIFMEVIHQYPDLTVRLVLFNAVITQGTPRMLEHNDIRWITTEQIDDYSFCPADKDILAVLKTVENGLQAALYANRDPTYHAFHTKLLPGIDPGTVLGVRMPKLRTLAKTCSSQLPGRLPHKYYEENILHALYINSIRDASAAIGELDRFLPYVDNWAVCDTLSPIAFRTDAPIIMDAVLRWLRSDHPYTVRFAIEVLMKYYLDERFTDAHLFMVAKLRHGHYYVRMMIAWYFATALAKQYTQTVKILEHKLLDPWTHNKTIQKATESYRISEDTKTYLRTLKIRKGATV